MSGLLKSSKIKAFRVIHKHGKIFTIVLSFILIASLITGILYVINNSKPTDKALANFSGAQPNWTQEYSGNGGYTYDNILASDSTGVIDAGYLDGGPVNLGTQTYTQKSFYQDIYLAKRDMNGNPLWANRAYYNDIVNNDVSDFGLLELYDMVMDKTGGAYVTGYAYGSANTYSTNTSLEISFSFGDQTLTLSPGSLYCMFVARISNSGQFLWVKGAGCGGEGRGLSVDSDNNVYVNGIYSTDSFSGCGYDSGNFGSYTICPQPSRSGFVTKLDPNGTFSWVQTYPIGVYANYKTKSALDSNKNLYFLSNDSILYKVNTLTKALVASTSDFGSSFTPNKVYVATDDKLYVAGTDDSSNIRLVVMDNNLNVVQAKSYQELGYAGSNSAKVTGSGQDIYIANEYWSNSMVASISPSSLNTLSTNQLQDRSISDITSSNGYFYASGVDYHVAVYQFGGTTSRLLDCRLIDPNNASQSIKVAPVIVPNYATTPSDSFGLTVDSNGSLYTLAAPNRNLYNDGTGSGPHTQNALYAQNLSIYSIAPSSNSTPGSISTLSVNGVTGRPMDIDMPSLVGAGNDLYVSLLQKSNSNQLSSNSDINGDVVGKLFKVNKTNGSASQLGGNLPASGYAKAYADMEVDSSGSVYFDDTRSVSSPNNQYTSIPKLNANGTLSASFSSPGTNSFFDIAVDNGTAYSLKGNGNTTPISSRNDIWSINPSTGVATALNLGLGEVWDGGEIITGPGDDTFDSNNTGQFIYYTSGEGVSANKSALIRINPSNGDVVKSDSDPVDVNFNARTTGFMDKVVFDAARQTIYYKKGSYSKNNPYNTIGKIYCPSTLAEANQAFSNPPLGAESSEGGDADQGGSSTSSTPAGTQFFAYSQVQPASSCGASSSNTSQTTSSAKTTVCLNINAGVAAIYAGDKNDNDDICTPGDDAVSLESVSCSIDERSIDLTSATVLNIRQETNALVYDILLEDLRGLAAAQYAVDVSMCNLEGDMNSDGNYNDVSYPLGFTSDGNGPLYARADADNAGTISALKPLYVTQAYQGGENSRWSKGSNTQVTTTTTPISLFYTTDTVKPGRYEIDEVELGFELPAYIKTAQYKCDVTYTLTV